MPAYIYEHPEDKRQVEIIQRMTDEHKYFAEGVEWNRVFTSPAADIDSLNNISAFDKQAFIKRTAKKGMTVGDMWNESKRLSDKRASSVGKDPVKEAAAADYKKKTTLEHPHYNQ